MNRRASQLAPEWLRRPLAGRVMQQQRDLRTGVTRQVAADIADVTTSMFPARVSCTQPGYLWPQQG